MVRAETQAPRATSATDTPSRTRCSTASRSAGVNRAFLWVFAGPSGWLPVGCLDNPSVRPLRPVHNLSVNYS